MDDEAEWEWELTPQDPTLEQRDVLQRSALARWRYLMYEKAVRRVEHWERMLAGTPEMAQLDRNRYARNAMAATIMALTFADHDLTVLAFEPPSDFGARDFDQLLWPDHAVDSSDDDAGEGPGINGEWMPCIMCGEPLKGDDVRMKSDGTEGDRGRYCARCSGAGP